MDKSKRNSRTRVVPFANLPALRKACEAEGVKYEALRAAGEEAIAEAQFEKCVDLTEIQTLFDETV